MPIYEYECGTCGERFEQMVKIGAPTPDCPKCQGHEVKKLISAASFVLKGSGWYKDHYGLKSGGSSSGGSSSGGSSSGGSSSGGSSSGGSSSGGSSSSSGSGGSSSGGSSSGGSSGGGSSTAAA